MKSERDQQQAKNADKPQPKDEGDQVRGFWAAKQDFVPDERNTDKSVGDDGDENTVVKESEMHSTPVRPS
jgi:hypothetical protein